MKKRLRKKLRVKEFFEPYCIIRGDFFEELSEEKMDEILDAFIEVVEALDFGCCGCTSPTDFDYTVGSHKKEKLSKNDAIYLNAFLINNYGLYIKSSELIYVDNEKNEDLYWKNCDAFF